MPHSDPLTRSLMRAAACGLMLLCVLMLTACTSTEEAEAGAGRIVALGDSSASGPELGPEYPDAPPECDRTTGGYPALVAGQVVHSDFVNETCSGAVASSLFTGYTYPSGNRVRAQLDALDGTEDVVLLNIGINNADSGDVGNNCLYHGGVPSNTCTSTYVDNGVNELIAKGQGIATPVGQAIDAVRAKSTHAKIFLVGYLDTAPPSAAGCTGRIFLTATDGPVFDRWEVAINDTLRSVAAAKGAHFVDAYSQSAGHTACEPVASQRWTNPYIGVSKGVPIHPTPEGAAAVAQMVTQAMSAAGVYLGPEAKLKPISFSKLRPTARGSVFTRNPPVQGGAPIELDLDQVADVSLRLYRVTSGRIVGGKCRISTKRNRGKPKCTRQAARGAWWTASLPRGNSKIFVTGRSAGHRLPAGKYRVSLRSSSLHVPTTTTKTFRISR